MMARPNDEILLDDGDADVALAALQAYARDQYRFANQFSDNRALFQHYLDLATNAERVARYIEAELYPEPEPDEPPDYSGDELLSIRRQSVTA